MSEMMKNIPLTRNPWHESFDWIISHIIQPVKKSVCHSKEKIMQLFEANKDNNAYNNIDKSIDYRPYGTSKYWWYSFNGSD